MVTFATLNMVVLEVSLVSLNMQTKHNAPTLILIPPPLPTHPPTHQKEEEKGKRPFHADGEGLLALLPLFTKITFFWILSTSTLPSLSTFVLPINVH